MTKRTKKILIIASVVLVLIFIGLLIYYLFFREKPPAPPTGPEEFPGLEGATPEVRARLVPITEEAVLSAVLAGENKINYAAWDGAVNQIDFNGENKERLGAVAAERIGEAFFSKDGSRLAVRQALPSGQDRYLIFDTKERSLKSLPAEVEALAFSPDGGQMALALAERNSSRLVLADADDTSKTTALVSVKLPDLALEWAAPDALTLINRPSGLAAGMVHELNLKNKALRRVIGGTYGLTSLFSPSHKKILFSETSSNGFGLTLNVLSTDKNTRRRLNIYSLPEKCAWSQDERTLWCG
ncbi:MAG: hypothetical protein AAB642_01855, partial [Patescibacteria group bacterium]